VDPGGVLIRSHPLIDDPGPIVTNGFPCDIYHCTSGQLSDLETLLGTGAFPSKSRWAAPNIQPSPGGSKLFITRGAFAPTSGAWYVSGGIAPPSSGTFRLGMGTFGNYLGGIYTFPIPYNASAEDVWTAIVTAQTEEMSSPILVDPRPFGYPYDPWGGGPLPFSQVQLRFHVIPPEGVWMDTDNHDLIDELWQPFSISPEGNFPDSGGPTHYYLCNADGSSLTEISFGDVELNIGYGSWSPDSSKLHTVVASASGHAYARWMVYDIVSGTVSFPLDYSSAPLDFNGYGPLQSLPKFSPDSASIVWVMNNSIWIAHSDGTGITELFHQTADDSSTSPDDLIIPTNTIPISWSFDSTKIAVVDERNPAAVWVIDVSTGTRTQVWPGTGWTNPAEQKWIYDPQTFTG
jgi:hypothetical protein